MAEIHIFSGLGSSLVSAYRKGTDELEGLIDALPSKADAHTHIWNNWPNVLKYLVRKSAKRKLKQPVILIGHSNGVLACAEIAKGLNKHGIEVQFIGAIDPTLKAFPEICSNVVEVREFLASKGFVALVRKWSKGAKGKVRLAEGARTAFLSFPVYTGHVEAASNKFVHRSLVSQVEKLLAKKFS